MGYSRGHDTRNGLNFDLSFFFRIMEILYLAPSFIPSKSANSVHVMKMCQAFSKNGHDVELVAMRGFAGYSRFSPKVCFDYYGVEHRFKMSRLGIPPVKGAETIMAARLLLIFLCKDRQDLLVYTRHLYGAVAAVMLGFSTIYEVHELPLGPFRKLLERWLFRRKKLVKLVVISEALRRLYQSKVLSGDGEKKIQVAHDGADVPRYKAIRELGSWVEKSSQHVLHLGYVGHLHEGRGIDLVLALAARTPECKYHVLGGDSEQVDRWSRLKSANVVFYGHRKPSMVKYFIHQMDVVLLPYQKKVFIDSGNRDTGAWMSPMKMFEYMAAGKPIISSDLRVLREVLAHEKNAFLVSPEDLGGWVAAVNKMKSAPLRQRLGDEAFKDFAGRFTWETRARDVLKVDL